MSKLVIKQIEIKIDDWGDYHMKKQVPPEFVEFVIHKLSKPPKVLYSFQTLRGSIIQLVWHNGRLKLNEVDFIRRISDVNATKEKA